MTQFPAIARVAMDPPEYAFPVTVTRGDDDAMSVGMAPVRKDGAGRYWFRQDDLVTFLTAPELN